MNLSEKLCGAFPAKHPSPVIGKIENDDGSIPKPLPYGTLSTRFIRNTNATGVYEQEEGNCYAFAAASAYINTIERIYGHTNPIPPFKECLAIANYNGGEGGDPSESIRLLEEHYQFGIRCDPQESVSIRETMMISVIVGFETSEVGSECIEKGELLYHPGGSSCLVHATLVEGYDLNKDCMICKNSWGGKESSPRFDFTPSACHWCHFWIVYFTIDSIKDKATKLIERLDRFNNILNGKKISCAWMDNRTALYSSEFVCEHHPERNGQLKYLGYNVQEWIDINLNRPKDKEYPKYHYINNIQCA